MKKLQTKQTTAENLEDKFNRGDDVLDYFDVREGRVVAPPIGQSDAKSKTAYVAKRGAPRRSAVAETSPSYKKKR
jgi:hypothetical protein